MDIGEKIKTIADKKGVKMEHIYSSIGMTNSGYYRMLKNNSFKVNTLIEIANVLQVPIDEFFEKEEEKLLIKGAQDDAHVMLFLALAGTAFEINTIIDKVNHAPDYTKENIVFDLKSIHDKLKITMELERLRPFSTINKHRSNLL